MSSETVTIKKQRFDEIIAELLAVADELEAMSK